MFLRDSAPREVQVSPTSGRMQGLKCNPRTSPKMPEEGKTTERAKLQHLLMPEITLRKTEVFIRLIIY